MSIDPSTYKTGNSSPSNSAEDLSDNARVFDVFMNDKSGDSVLDRLGVPIPTLSKALQGIGWVSVGEWSTNPTITEPNQYVFYNNQRFAPVNLPYPVDSAAHPDPNALVPSELRDVSSFIDSNYLSKVTNYEADNLNGMLTGLTAGGEDVVIKSGQVWRVGRQTWIINASSGIPTNNGLYAQERISVSRDYGSSLCPSQLDTLTLLSEVELDETVVGKLQGFEYDEENNRCFLVSYLDTGNPFPESETITISEYNTDDDGVITTLVNRSFNLGFGHGEALLVDTSEAGKTYLWISVSSDGSGSSALRRIEWNNGPVCTQDFPCEYTLFSWADVQNGSVLFFTNGENHYIDFSKFKIGDFTPFYIESRQSLEDALVISSGNQSFKKRYGEYYGLSGFQMSAETQADEWKSSCFLSTKSATLRLSYVNNNSPLVNNIEPQNIGWKRKSNGDLVTVIACKSPDAVRLFQCSGHDTRADSGNLSDGAFKKLNGYNSPISRSQTYTESLNPFAAMLVGIGSSSTSTSSGDDYNLFYMTQEGNTGTRQAAAINHHDFGKFVFYGDQQTSDGWTGKFGFRYWITDASKRGDLGTYPIQLTSDGLVIGGTSPNNNKAAIYANATGSNVSAFKGSGLLGFAGNDFGSEASVFYLSFVNGTSRDRAYAVFNDRFRPNTDGGSSLGEPNVRWDTIELINQPSVTCDARLKTTPRSMDTEEGEALKRAIKKVPFNMFEYLESLKEKGGTHHEKGTGYARTHFGPMAQDIIAAFESEGLDPWKYAVIQRQEWPASDAIYSEEGDLLHEATEAGERYKVLTDQFIMMRLAAAGI